MSEQEFDVHAMSGPYAVDALDDIERAAFERHLAECAECRAEVAGLREAASLLVEDSAIEPPVELRARVLAGIATVRPLPPAAGPQPATAHEAARPLARRRRGALLLAAAAAVVAVGAGGVVAWQQPWDQPSATESAADAIIHAPDAQATSVEFSNGARATVIHSDAIGRALIRTSAMPAPPSGKVYQLWLQQPGQGMVSAGLMPADIDHPVLLEGDAATATAAGITVEPAGGSPEPTSPPIALFDFGENASGT